MPPLTFGHEKGAKQIPLANIARLKEEMWDYYVQEHSGAITADV